MKIVSETPSKPVSKNRARAPSKPGAARVVASGQKTGPVDPAKVTAKPRAKATPAGSEPAAVHDRPAKNLKVRLVRDSFTMPEGDFALVAALKARALGLGRATKKSELLRAGLQLLSQQSDSALLSTLNQLQPIKTGRPRRGD